MMCPKCKQKMQLRHCIHPNYESFIYECESCTIILSPLLQVIQKPQIYIEKIKEEIKEKNES